MYNKKDIVKTLNEFNYFIDESTLSSFIKNWKIDPIYEDEDGVEFYDNLSIVKLKKGISLKSQGYTNEQIIYHIKKILEEKPVVKKEKTPQELTSEVSAVAGELKNLTVDVSSQTLQMISDAVAEKIISGIKDQFHNSEFVTQLLQDGTLKKDNEELSKQVTELMEDNKKLAKRVEELEKHKRTFPINFEYFRKFFR